MTETLHRRPSVSSLVPFINRPAVEGSHIDEKLVLDRAVMGVFLASMPMIATIWAYSLTLNPVSMGIFVLIICAPGMIEYSRAETAAAAQVNAEAIQNYQRRSSPPQACIEHISTSPSCVIQLLEGEKGLYFGEKKWRRLMQKIFQSPAQSGTVFEALVSSGKIDVMQKDRRCWSIFKRAVEIRDSFYLATLLRLKPESMDVNEQNMNGLTALMRCAQKGVVARVKMLLAAGADKTLTNNRGKTARDLIRGDHAAELQALLA